ncbi:hypothetical protein R84981_002827 [Carnimonas sp. R-84981]|uniref:DUF4054 domain-containing protein n=1 Tax=Carnimonas bestiolae TaxID=3402172 RepID=UPI003EDC65C0
MFKKGPLPTVQQFRNDFPQFSDATDAQIQFRLNLAGNLIRVESVPKDIYPYVAELFVSHYLAMYGYGPQSSDGSYQNEGITQSNGLGKGNVASKQVDKVSISFDYGIQNSSLNPDAGWWNNTVYGQEFYNLINMFGMGGRQL